MKVLQHLMGHSDVETTEIYVHLANMLNVGEYSKHSIINILDKKKTGSFPSFSLWSERQDLNLRPLDPQSSALPS